MTENLGKRLVKYMPEATFIRSADAGLANAKANLSYIKHSIRELDVKTTGNSINRAMVVGAGPSLHRKDPAKLLIEHNFDGPFVCMDSSMGYCLRNGIVPEYVVVVDPDENRVIRWFGDHNLDERPSDDYFDRQELDPTMHQNAVNWNRQIMELVNLHGPKMKAILATSVHPVVRDRCIEAGMEVYWWNPMYDDYEKSDSFSRGLYEMTNVPLMVTGGNVGTSSWVFAAGILGAKEVALVGMDLGYPPDNPKKGTQYYNELLELFGDRIEETFIDVYNPYLDETWYADPAYYWFREGFIQLAQMAPCATFNCTEGGTVFGAGIEFIKLEDYLKRPRNY